MATDNICTNCNRPDTAHECPACCHPLSEHGEEDRAACAEVAAGIAEDDLQAKARAVRDAAEAFALAALSLQRACATFAAGPIGDETSPAVVAALADRGRLALAAEGWALGNAACERVAHVVKGLQRCSAGVHGPELTAAATLEGGMAAGRVYEAARGAEAAA